MTTDTTGAREIPTSVVASSRTVTFTAQELDGLTRQMTAWLLEHPSAAVLAFGHAAETRFVVRTPPSLAGPEPLETEKRGIWSHYWATDHGRESLATALALAGKE